MIINNNPLFTHNNNSDETKETTEEIIQQARDEHGIKKFVGLFSGGKDSLVACHFLSKLGVLDEVLYCNTGINVKENFEYVLKACNQYGWRLNVLHPKQGETYEDFWCKFGGPPGEAMHNAIMYYLKWHPLRIYAREHFDRERFAFVSGRRKKESKRRAKIMGKNKTVIEQAEKRMLFVAPLYYWTDKDVWNYIAENKLERCPVYDTLHISGDCLCGAFAESGEAELLSIFHRPTAEHIAELEHRYGGRWGRGRGSSIIGAMKQEQLPQSFTEAVCNECIVRAQQQPIST